MYGFPKFDYHLGTTLVSSEYDGGVNAAFRGVPEQCVAPDLIQADSSCSYFFGAGDELEFMTLKTLEGLGPFSPTYRNMLFSVKLNS